MKTNKLGIILMILGLIMMIYTGFTYITSEKVVDLGPIQISQEKKHPIQWSPIVGAILLIGGVTMTVFSKNVRK